MSSDVAPNRVPAAVRRHLVVGLGSALAVVSILAITELSVETWGKPDERKADGLLWQFNVATGTTALLLIVITLSFTPVRFLMGRRHAPVHLPWRRVTGVWSAVLVATHIPGGLAIHSTGWRVWTPFESVVPGVTGRAIDEFTLGYWVGLVAALALIPLTVTSRNSSIRALGPRRWHRLHRTLTWSVYWLAAVHVVALQYGEFRDRRHVAATAVIFATALAGRSVAAAVGQLRRTTSRATGGARRRILPQPD